MNKAVRNTPRLIDPKSLSKSIKREIWQHIKKTLPGLEVAIEIAIAQDIPVDISILNTPVTDSLTDILDSHSNLSTIFDEDELVQGLIKAFDATIIIERNLSWTNIVSCIACDMSRHGLIVLD